jgi:alkylhydroperoxidase/carboxymuconolactone decarboxylase family protein YurZ
MRAQLAGARDNGATDDEILETLYLSMRAAAAHVRQEAFKAMEEVCGEVIRPDSGA